LVKPTTNAIARGCASQEVCCPISSWPNFSEDESNWSLYSKAMLTGRIVNGKIEIPVNVNVLYRTAAENISHPPNWYIK
jgi:hypothetical protein